MYFKKKRGIVPDVLVQMRLTNFRKNVSKFAAYLGCDNVASIDHWGNGGNTKGYFNQWDFRSEEKV